MSGIGDKIDKNEYNALVNSINTYMGNSTNTSSHALATNGYGQTINALGVSESDKISVEQYGRVITDMYNWYRHIYGSNPPTNYGGWPNNVGLDKIIDSSTSVNDNGPSRPFTRWAGLISTLASNRYVIPAAAVATTTNHSNVSYAGTWSGSATCIVSVSWPTARDARHFFNSGGQIQFTSALSTTSFSAQDASWASLLSVAGTQSFGGQTPASGGTPVDGSNWFRCGSTYQNPFYTASASSPYTANYYRIYARTPGINNSTGTASSIEFTLFFNDGHVGLGGPPAQGSVGSNTYGPDVVGPASLQIATTSRKASGFISLYPSGSQGFNIITPAVSVGAITVS
jgi:hypothetical protein|tara:strand:+ start:2224 stop:3252 length:1029 start_codon:yes stop_codon:yes gene_type:complete